MTEPTSNIDELLTLLLQSQAATNELLVGVLSVTARTSGNSECMTLASHVLDIYVKRSKNTEEFIKGLA